jgi:saccharopine dehydrogenase (NAD+, L-lysine forming)
MKAPYPRIALLREGKEPPDRRVALTPYQCRAALQRWPGLHLVVQSSPHRAYTDHEYTSAGISLVDDVNDQDLLIGIKEVPVAQLLSGKCYMFFSHTIKEQAHNRSLLRAVLEKRITLIDHELLADGKGQRVLAFGHWAGVVGAYNAFRAWQAVHGGTPLKPAHACADQAEMMNELQAFPIPKNLRVVVTGNGRVGKGAAEVLRAKDIAQITPSDFLNGSHAGPAFTVLGSQDLYHRADGRPFDRQSFHDDPTGHDTNFLPFAQKAQMLVACHFWDPRSVAFLGREVLEQPSCALKVVADISCDIGGPIASTLRASTIASPFYGYHRTRHRECAVGEPGSIAVMAVDNLPCELPRDASEQFGADLFARVLPHFLGPDPDNMIGRATIAQNGELTSGFTHLETYAGVGR